MDSMAMPFPVAKGVPLEGLAANDKVEITLHVDWEADSPVEITRLRKLPPDTKLVFREARPSRVVATNLISRSQGGIMPVRKASAVWEGSVKEGQGTVKLGSGAFEGRYSFGSRFEEAAGTNPEELIGAAHAGCFSMALSAGLGRAGFSPKRVATSAKVHLEKVGEGFKITRIELDNESEVPGIEDAAFQEPPARPRRAAPCPRPWAASRSPSTPAWWVEPPGLFPPGHRCPGGGQELVKSVQ